MDTVKYQATRDRYIELGLITPDFAPVEERSCNTCQEPFMALVGHFGPRCPGCEFWKKKRDVE